MMQAEDREAADAAFTALVRQAREEADGVVACLDVDGLLAKVKQVAADNHDQATLALGQLQKELQLVGATLTRAFSAPVQTLVTSLCRLRSSAFATTSLRNCGRRPGFVPKTGSGRHTPRGTRRRPGIWLFWSPMRRRAAGRRSTSCCVTSDR